MGLVPPQPKGQGTIAPNVKDPLHASQDGMIHSNQILHGDQIRREELLGSTTPPSLEGGVAWILLRDLYAVANIPVPYVVWHVSSI